MSRNKDRLGGVQQPDTNPPLPVMQAQAAGDSSGFSFVIPTEFVELPSEGKFYGEGHPLCGADSIEIRQMTAKEEDILTSRTLLKKGVAIDRVIANIIVDKRIDPDSLLVGDRNAVIIATRISGYGSQYPTKVTCPQCATMVEHTFDLQTASIYAGGDAADLEVANNQDGTFNVTLPRTQLTVTFKLMTGKDEKALVAGMEKDRKQKVHERAVTRSLFNMVVAVNDDSSADAINYLIANIPTMDARHLRHAYRLAAPNVDLSQHFACTECEYAEDMEVPLNADFFWPDR